MNSQHVQYTHIYKGFLVFTEKQVLNAEFKISDTNQTQIWYGEYKQVSIEYTKQNLSLNIT